MHLFFKLRDIDYSVARESLKFGLSTLSVIGIVHFFTRNRTQVIEVAITFVHSDISFLLILTSPPYSLALFHIAEKK